MNCSYKNSPWALIILFCLGGSIYAQADRFRIHSGYWEGFVLKPEIELQGGISLPRGAYRAIAGQPGREGAATMGYYGELSLVQCSAKHPLWNLRLNLGYMQHGFDRDGVMSDFGLDALNVDNWTIAYIMPGLGFRGGGDKLKFELQAALGILLYNGWNARRGILDKIQHLEVYSWKFKRSLGGALRLGGQLGYKLGKKTFVFANASIFFGNGRREGQRSRQLYEIDPLYQIAIEPPIVETTETVRQNPIFSMINLGLGFRYRFFEYLYDPNQRYKKYY